MGGFLVQQGASVLCAHGGQAQPTVPSPRVRLGGSSAVTTSPPWTVSGCANPMNVGGPCTVANWLSGTVRVTAGGQPLVIQGGSATTVPNGVPLNVVSTQTRVQAQ